MELGDFLSRPVLIETKVWGVNTQLADTIRPWEAFLTHPAIKDKIEHYSLLRMKLKIKLVLSASPFYYGLGMVSYNPTPLSHTDASVVIGGDHQLVTYSQRPHFYFNVTESMGGDMELPFFWPYNWLRNDSDIVPLDSFRNMGTLRLDSFGDLRNSNGVVDDLTIKVYAWAEDIELSGPTAKLQSAYQPKKMSRKKRGKKPSTMSIKDNITNFGLAKDEYGDGPVSGVASAVASAANSLSNIPVIGPFARATEIGAGVVSRVASFFGFTKVPVIENVRPVKDLPFGNFASAETSEPVAKLTLDPKCELTIDSRTVGLDGSDELSLESYVTRESYMMQFNWETSDLADDPLMGMIIDPTRFYRKNNSDLWLTPIAHASMVYKQWTGTIILRLQVIASQYHRGRIKVQWDPSANITGAVPAVAPSDTTNITRIFDIQETQDIEFCIPWMQHEPFAEIGNVNSGVAADFVEAFTTGGAAVTGTDGNGFLRISVANQLTAPDALSGVSFAVSVRAGDDYTLMNPRGAPNNLRWTLQAEYEEHAPNGVDATCLNGGEDMGATMPLVYGGETNLSIRQLLQRQQFWRVDTTGNSTGLAFLVYNTYLKNMFPLPNGAITLALDALDQDIFGDPVNYCANTYYNWFTKGFAGQRGSMVWVHNYDAPTDVSSVEVSRAPGSTSAPNVYAIDTPIPDANFGPSMRYATLADLEMGQDGAGCALYNMRTQTGVSTLIPYVSPHRFSGSGVNPYRDIFPNDQNDTTFKVVTTSHPSIADSRFNNLYSYVSVGPDYNCFFFTGIPTMRIATLVNP